jgi:DnaJ family protein C protein 2
VAVLVDKVIAACGEDTARLDRVTQAIKTLETAKSITALRDLLQSVSEGKQVEDAPAVAVVASVDNAATVNTATVNTATVNTAVEEITWSVEELDFLINAAKTFPGGSAARWERITEQINRQIQNANSAARQFTPQQVIKRANELQDANEAEEHDAAQAAAALAASKKKRDPRVDLAAPTVAAHYFGDDGDRAEESAKENSGAAVWCPEDQIALESALKAVPADDANRWDRVADLVPGKNKKDCLQRVKEIAQMLKSRQ